jgi:phosphate starvation-inducible PhoH-like protein
MRSLADRLSPIPARHKVAPYARNFHQHSPAWQPGVLAAPPQKTSRTGEVLRELLGTVPSQTLHFPSARHLHQLFGGREENLTHAEQKLKVTLISREDWLKIEGTPEAVARAEALFGFLNEARTQGLVIRTPDFHRFVDAIAKGEIGHLRALFKEPLVISTNRKTIVPKTLGQKLYLQSIQQNPVVFGIGPAGTGKTYLAMAMAVSALLKNKVERIILTRPAVEAGEALGFLPGDLREKILPYLRPLHDALHDMMDDGDVAGLTEKGVIEIAPLAYMRGRTLGNAFVVLDEAQNTTPEQMMMFLTRLGENSRMIVTGDVTQIDLPRVKTSGLVEVERILGGIDGIDFHYFSGADVVRHPLVLKIIEAYDRYKNPMSGQ